MFNLSRQIEAYIVLINCEKKKAKMQETNSILTIGFAIKFILGPGKAASNFSKRTYTSQKNGLHF